VWIAQIKDGYWNPYYTALVVAAFCIMPVCKFGGAMRLPPYDTEKLCKGFCAGAASAVCFLVGLDDAVDPFRLFHGLSQVRAAHPDRSARPAARTRRRRAVAPLPRAPPARPSHAPLPRAPPARPSQALVGLSLYYLWQLVPLNVAKKTDDEAGALGAAASWASLPARGSSLARVMSTHDLPISRLEYY
jgi:hypothetical protein